MSRFERRRSRCQKHGPQHEFLLLFQELCTRSIPVLETVKNEYTGSIYFHFVCSEARICIFLTLQPRYHPHPPQGMASPTIVPPPIEVPNLRVNELNRTPEIDRDGLKTYGTSTPACTEGITHHATSDAVGERPEHQACDASVPDTRSLRWYRKLTCGLKQ